MTIAIRTAGAGDAPAIALLLGELGYPCAPEAAAARLAALEGQAADRVLVAQDEGAAAAPDAVLGVLHLHHARMLHLDRPVTRVMSLVVRQGTRGRGIGVALLRAAEEEARRAGADTIELTSGLKREAAHAFYRARGFGATSLRFRIVLPPSGPAFAAPHNGV